MIDFQPDKPNNLDFQLDFQPEKSGGYAGTEEAIANMVLGIPGYIAGGLAGLGTYVGTGGDINKAAEIQNKVTSTLSPEPSEQALPATQKIQGLFNSAADTMTETQKATIQAIPFIGNELSPNATEALARVGSEAVLNFLPLHAITEKGKVEPKVSVANPDLGAKLDQLITKDETRPVGTQGELPLDFKPEHVVDTSNITNPYDVAKYVTELKEGNVKELDAPTKDLFSVSDEVAPKEPIAETPIPPEAKDVLPTDGENFRVGEQGYSGKGLPEAYKFADDIKQSVDMNGNKSYSLDLSSALERISKDTANPEPLRVTADLLKTKYIDKYADNVYAELNHREGFLDRNAENGTSVAGKYDPNISDMDYYKFGLTGLKASTIVHEVMHGATVKLMQARPNSAAVQSLVKIWDWSQNMAENIGKDGEYGFKDVYEMISEAYSNPNFQQTMSKIDLPYSMRIKNSLSSVWDNIKYAIAKLFNNDKAPSEKLFSALDGVIHHTNELLKSYDITPTEGSKKSLAEYLKEQADTLDNRTRIEREAFDLRRPSSIDKINSIQKTLALSLDEKLSGTELMKNKASTFKPDPTPQEAVKGPLRGELSSYVPEDPPVDKIISDALQGEDSPMKYTGLQSGSILTGIKYNSPLIQGVGRLMLNAQKRADLANKAIIKPVEKLFDPLFRNDTHITDLATIFKKEMFSNKRFSVDDLKTIGVPDKLIDAHQAMRKMFDDVLEKQNEALIVKGEKPITAKDAYLSSRWQGSFRIPVYEGKKLVWYIAERTEKDAKNALAYLEANGVNVNKDLSKLEFRGHGIREGNAVDAYKTMLSLLDDGDPRIATIKSIMEDAAVSEAHKAFGQSKHFENKANIRGFIGDQPWKDSTVNAREMFKQQFQYAKNAVEWSEVNKTMDSVKTILSNEDLQKTQPNNMKFVREHVKNKLGMGEDKAIASLEGSIAKLFGRDISVMRNTVGSLKSVYYTITFGLNLPFAAMSTMQGAFAAPWHTKLSTEGFKFNPATTMTKSIMDSTAIVMHHELANRGLSKELHMTDIGKAAMKYAEDNGIIERNMFDESRELGKNPALRTALNVANLTITFPEKVARTMSFMSFVHHLEESGKFEKTSKGMNDLFQKAEDYTYATMADYRKGERPLIFSRLGVIGDAVSTLRTFSFNYYNQLHSLAREGMKGNYAPIITFLGVQAVLGGVVSLPFVTEGEKAMEFLKETFSPFLPVKAFNTIKDLNIRKFLVEHLPEWAAYGGVSALSGVDFSSRMNSPNFVPDANWDSLFPFAIPDIREAKSIVNFAQDPNKDTLAQIAYAHSPNGLQGAIETLYPGFKTGETGPEGTGYLNPKDLTRFGTNRSPTEETIRLLGMRSLKEAHRKDLLFRQIEEEQLIKEKQTQVEGKFTRALLRGDQDELSSTISDYITLGGDYNKLTDGVQNMLLRAKVPQETLVAIAAQNGNLSSAMKLQRYIELFKSYREQYQ